ncbi:MAG: DUF1501 domain-containing protein [Flavobacteriaceae bacterium]|nr:DUF1501 domain-containing protein [Bacteroidia bacterium]MBT8288920.1 DUF1501 domain-containing protein [Bacteroidia bacterium]NNF74103.1 DUF1501 domain-containing protein [Flavobacteriaceae bacterium]NNK71812.1 DUF1501 domain-containing protein [Flavobacteriaceae bacterium]
MKRREFVKQTSLVSSLLLVPRFIQAFDDLVTSASGYRRLVVIQLSGGNDGLNTIVPYRNDIYYSSRPNLALRSNNLIALNDELALHNSLTPFMRLYEKGYVSILNNVGYPNPDRSHFRSMDIWHTASHSHEYLQTGWIGRYLDANGEKPYNAIELNEKLSLALKGQVRNGMATNNAQLLYRTAQDPYFKTLIKHQLDDHLGEHNLGYLYRTLISAESSAKYIYEKSKTKRSNEEYSKGSFGRQMKSAAQFINSGLKTRVFYVAQNGYDTHANQKQTQARLLGNFAVNLEKFVIDLKKAGTFEDTLIMVFSEFGRRVKQNAAQGTDHGAANSVFILGENLKKPGIFNEPSNLTDLDTNGDIKYEIDFRAIYSSILRDWMRADVESVISGDFPPITLV